MGVYHVPLPAEYFYAFSFCLDCCVWGALSVGWKFVVPLYGGACSLWWCWTSGLSRFLVRGACVCVLVGGAESLWSAMKCPIVSFELSVGLVSLLTACILMLRGPVLLEN